MVKHSWLGGFLDRNGLALGLYIPTNPEYVRWFDEDRITLLRYRIRAAHQPPSGEEPPAGKPASRTE